ncbi:MAG: RNA pseudouridine synthase [Alphaproteobacteria bacterium]|nr:MAG: RNA pseudouridine synthase [Alphaproteobacteria bacterium]
MIIKDDDDGQRLDRFLKREFPQIGFGQTQKLIRTGQIRMDGKRVKSDARMVAGAELRLPPSLQDGKKKTQVFFSQKDHDFITSVIMYEDSDIIILNKPPRLAVQGGSKTIRHIDGMLNSYMKKGVKPRLVHRLDKDTSGVLILAKTADAARALTKGFQDHTIQKTYWALTSPSPEIPNGTINAKLSKSIARHDGGEMMVHDEENGKKSTTDYEILDKAGKDAAFVAFYPKTGRTHQIRVHAAIMGAPLLGDTKYNPEPHPFDNEDIHEGLHLHAREITFRHPTTKEIITADAPLPDLFLKSWKTLGFNV